MALPTFSFHQERFFNDFPPLPEEELYSFATGRLVYSDLDRSWRWIEAINSAKICLGTFLERVPNLSSSDLEQQREVTHEAHSDRELQGLFQPDPR